MRETACAMSAGPVTASSRIVNSSPPKRETVSEARTHLHNRSPMTTRSWSPAAGPPLAADREKWVAAGVPEAVVDVLEVVNVEEEHRKRVLARPLQMRERVRDA